MHTVHTQLTLVNCLHALVFRGNVRSLLANEAWICNVHVSETRENHPFHLGDRSHLTSRHQGSSPGRIDKKSVLCQPLSKRDRQWDTYQYLSKNGLPFHDAVG